MLEADIILLKYFRHKMKPSKHEAQWSSMYFQPCLKTPHYRHFVNILSNEIKRQDILIAFDNMI